MAVYTLFGQPASPGTLDSDTTAYTLGNQFSAAKACAATAVWWYSAPGAGVLPSQIAIYQVSGTTLVHSESATWSGSAGSGWVRAAFSSPPTLAASTDYKVCVLGGNGSNSWYSDAAHYWDVGAGASGITNGILSAPNSASSANGQSSFNTSPTLAYPASVYQATNFWIDVEVSDVYVVQSAKESFTGPGISFDNPVAAGNTVMLIPILYGSGDTLTSSAPTLGGNPVPGTALLQGVSNALNGTSAYHGFWVLPNCPGGQTAVSFNQDGASIAGVFVYEVAGLGPSPILDTQASGVNSAGSPTAAVDSGVTGAIGAATGIVFGASALYSAGTAPTQSYWSATTGGGGADDHDWAGYTIPGSAGNTYEWAQTMDAPSNQAWTAGIIALRSSPINVVQIATFDTNGTETYSGNFASPVTAGNTVIITGSGYNSSGNPMYSATPTLGGNLIPNSYKLLDEGTSSGGVCLYSCAWLIPNVPGGDTSFGLTVFNNAYNGSANGLIAYEVSGLGTYPQVDVSNGAAGSGSSSISTGFTGNTTAANEFILAFTAQDEFTTDPDQPDSPWAVTSLNSAQNFSSAYQIAVNAGQTFSASYTLDTTCSYCLGIVGIKPGNLPPVYVVQTKVGNYNDSFDLPTTAGNTVFLCPVQYDTASNAMSSSNPLLGGASVTGTSKISETTNGAFSSAMYQAAWMLPNIPAGQTTYAVSVSGGSTPWGVGMIALEVAGLGPSPTLDKLASNFGSSVTADSGTTGATTAASEFILALGAAFNGFAHPSQIAPWTNANPGYSANAIVSYQVAGTSGGTYDWSQPMAGNEPWTAAVMTIKPGSGSDSAGMLLAVFP